MLTKSMRYAWWTLLILVCSLNQLVPCIAKTNGQSNEKNHRTEVLRKFAGVDYFFVFGEWSKAAELLVQIREFTEHQTSSTDSSYVSLLLAGVHERLNMLELARNDCSEGLAWLDHNYVGRNRLELEAGRCLLLFKKADMLFYLQEFDQANKNLDAALSIAKSELVHIRDPQLLVEITYRRALFLEHSDPKTADTIFENCRKIQISEVERLVGGSLQKIVPVGDSLLLLKTTGVESSTLNSVNRAIDCVPIEWIQILSRKGYFVLLLPVSQRTEFNGKVGYPHDGNSGLFLGRRKCIVIYINSDGFESDCKGTVLHEFGHAVDDALGELSQTDVFYRAYSEDFQKRTGHVLDETANDYWKTPRAASESFADRFADLLTPHLLTNQRENSSPNVDALVFEKIKKPEPHVIRFPNRTIKSEYIIR